MKFSLAWVSSVLVTAVCSVLSERHEFLAYRSEEITLDECSRKLTAGLP